MTYELRPLFFSSDALPFPSFCSLFRFFVSVSGPSDGISFEGITGSSVNLPFAGSATPPPQCAFQLHDSEMKLKLLRILYYRW